MDVGEVPDVPEWVAAYLREQGIESLYPPQAEAVEQGVTGGESLVASVPTASGKTLIAQLAMLAAVDRGGTALYIVPLRALASEKREEFAAFESYGVEIGVSTGNYEDRGEWLSGKDVVVATSEKVDSLVRNGAPWIEELTCVVADEVHLVDDAERGPTLEVTLAKLRRLNPALQVVALSATVGNAGEIADWLDAALVDSEWRPIDLRKGVHYGQAVHFDDGSQEELRVHSGEKPTAAIVRDTLADGGSTLVFVNSRRNAEGAAKRLANTTEGHLDAEERERLAELAEELRGVSDTETSEDLAACVERGAAFHHAGLCVTGETQILRPDGTFDDIRDIVLGDSYGRAIGLADFDLSDVAITDTFEMGERPILEVTTNTGNKIELSQNHPLPVLSDGGVQWISAEELEPGEYIARPRCTDLEIDTPELHSLVPDGYRVYRQYDTINELAENVDLGGMSWFRQDYTRNRNIRLGHFRMLCDSANVDPNEHISQIICQGGQKPISIPRYLNRDVSWLVGAVAGDGFITRHAVTLTGRSNLISEFSSVVEETFERDVSKGTSPSGTPYVTLHSKLIAEILTENFGIPVGEKATGLRVPDVGLPDTLMAEYLSGLFDADGSVSPRQNEHGAPCIELYSINERFIDQVKTTLLRFGLIAYKDVREQEGVVNHRPERDIRAKHDVYRLTIYGSDQLRAFRDMIGFRHSKKADLLSTAIEQNPPGGRGQHDVIPPGLGSYVRRVRQELGLSMADLEPDVPKATLSRYENGQTPMQRTTFQRLANQLDSPLLTDIAYSDVYWDRVDRIDQRDAEPLYDLTTSSSNFVANGIIAHNTSDQRSVVEDAFRQRLVKVVSATPTLAAGVNTPSRRVVVRDWRRYSSEAGGMRPLSVLEIHQMMGRAGRPGLDPYGEALLLASSHDELDELFERYVWAEPEPVRSKLATQPAMRKHLLATIASGFANSREGILEFLGETLYATQTDEIGRLETVADDMLDYLHVNGFIERTDGHLNATNLGHTTSRLYLDPMSAATIVDGLTDADGPPSGGTTRQERPPEDGTAEIDDGDTEPEFLQASDMVSDTGTPPADDPAGAEVAATGGDEVTPFGLYHLVSRTPDMYELYLRSGDREEYTVVAYDREAEFCGAMPSEFEEERFDDWLSAVKTARMLEDWADETDEDVIAESYGVGPGDIRGKVDTAEWLLGAAESLAAELDLPSVTAVRRARKRVQHGVSEELLDLTSTRGVGRKRARRLYDAGIESRADLRSAEKSVVLGALRGRRATAERILEAAGHQDPDMDGVTPDVDARPNAGAGDGPATTGNGGPEGAGGGGEGRDDQSNLGDF